MSLQVTEDDLRQLRELEGMLFRLSEDAIAGIRYGEFEPIPDRRSSKFEASEFRLRMSAALRALSGFMVGGDWHTVVDKWRRERARIAERLGDVWGAP